MNLDSSKVSSINATETIKIGFFAPKTAASLYFYEPWSRQGFELGIIYSTDGTNSTVDGRPFEILFYDTKGLVEDARSLAISAIENDKIDILVGGTYSDVAQEIAQVAEEYKKLYFITPGADADLTGKNFNPYTFRIARNNWHDAFAGVTYAMDTLGAKKCAFLSADYSFGHTGVETMKKVIEAKEGSVVSIQFASLTTYDFTPYFQNILTTEMTTGIDYLFIIWSGNFAYLWQDIADFNTTDFMDVGGAVIDLYSTNAIEENLPDPHTLEGSTGLCLYGYELPDNPVNDWMVNQHILRNIKPNSGLGLDYRVPELFTASGFATAQFLVNVTNAVKNLEICDLINHLENNLTINTPKGPTYLRPEDHQGLAEMYIAEVWNDTRMESETYGYLIPKLVEKLDPMTIAPPIESSYTPGSLKRSRSTPAPLIIGSLIILVVIRRIGTSRVNDYS